MFLFESLLHFLYRYISNIFFFKLFFSKPLESFSLKLALFFTLNNLLNILNMYTYKIVYKTVPDDDC